MIRTDMKISREVIRQIVAGNSYRTIQRNFNVSAGFVAFVKRKIVQYPNSPENLVALSDQELEQWFYPPSERQRYEPDWEQYHEKLVSNKKLTLLSLYEIWYRQECQDLEREPLSYSSFCRLYGDWKLKNGHIARSTNRSYTPGEIMEVDYSGDRLTWYDTVDGGKHVWEVFVATLPASKMMFAYATPKQSRDDWILGIVNALNYFGGAPQVLIVDNAKTLVLSTDRYQAVFPAQLQHLCEHYAMISSACTVRKPTHKNRVEASVNETQRFVASILLNSFIYAKDASELNQILKNRSDNFNDRKFSSDKSLSRRMLFEASEQKSLTPLPLEPYDIAQWHILRVDKGHCIRIHSDRGHRYSVDASYVGLEILVRIGLDTITCYDKKTLKCIATHERAFNAIGEKTHILPEHLTEAEKHLRLTKDHFINELVRFGLNKTITSKAINTIYQDKPDLVARKWCCGILNHFKKNPNKVLWSDALSMALASNICTYRHILECFETLTLREEAKKYQTSLALEEIAADECNPDYQSPVHTNIRNDFK